MRGPGGTERRGAAALVLLLASSCVASPDLGPSRPLLASPPVAQAVPAPAQAVDEEYVARRAVEVPVDASRLAGAKSAQLWYTTDGGRTWINHGAVDPAKPTAVFPAPSDGRFGFRIVPVGPDGQPSMIPKPGDAPGKAWVVDTVPPVVELLSPNGGEIFGARKSTLVQWAAEDANVAPGGVTIEFSADGKDWSPVGKDHPNSGKYHWDIGALGAGAARLRIRVRDLAGNVGSDESDRPFVVDALPPDFRITSPSSTSENPARIEWVGGDLGGAGLKRVSLWVTRDAGLSWKPCADDEDLRSPTPFPELDGVYGLYFVGEDRVGNAGSPPVAGTRPQQVLTVDRTAPEVQLLSPAAGGYLAGMPLEIQWRVRDNLELAADGIDLHLTADGGKTWTEIARGLKNTGVHAWKAPAAAGPDYGVRITATDLAGNRKEVRSARFGIDAGVPEARATGPDRSRSHSVQIAYELRNVGAAPVKKVTLYYRPEHVKEWIPYGDDPDAQSPMLFAKADGRYAIAVVCATESGLKSGMAQKKPEPEAEPQLLLTIDATPPQVNLETFNGGGYVMAGAAMDVKWTLLEPNPDPRGISVLHSRDGGASWNRVAENLDSTKGLYRWTVPATGGARHRLRVAARDRFGNEGFGESEKPFTIDAELPLVSMLEKPVPVTRSTRTSVRYKASDLTSGVEKVVLLARKTGPYKPLAETRNLEGVIEAELPGEGVWDLILVATDTAGHASTDADRAAKPDARVSVDLTAPRIELRSSLLPQGTKTWITPNWEVEWAASDNASTAEKLSVRIESSSDGGKTWFIAVSKHPNTGRADLRAHLLAGKKYQLRLVAVDEAGNEAEQATADFDPGDVPPAPLVFRGIDDGRSYVAGSVAPVAWASPDKTIREAVLEMSQDGARTWIPMATLHTESMKFQFPDKAGRYHFRMSARDSIQRPISSNFASVDVIEGVDQVRLIANPVAEPDKLVRVLIEPKGILKTAKDLVLMISPDGKEWRPIGEVKSTDFTFPAPGLPGDYVMKVAVRTPEGKEYESNHARLKVGGKDPGGIRLLSFRGGQTYPGGTGRIIAVQAAADPAVVRVEFSEASGADGSWKDITAEMQKVNTGFFWRLPKARKATCRLRVSFKDAQGKEHSDASERDFSIEGPENAPAATPAQAAETPKKAGLLVSPIPGTLKGGTSLPLEWKSEDPSAKVTLVLLIGDRAEAIAKDQPAQGKLAWEIPKVDAKAAAIRVIAGNRSETTAAFSIRSTAPAIEGVEIELPRK